MYYILNNKNFKNNGMKSIYFSFFSLNFFIPHPLDFIMQRFKDTGRQMNGIPLFITCLSGSC